MKKIIFITIYLISQTLFSQNIENNCFKCKYEFKEFYYVNFVYQYNYGIVFMNLLTEGNEIIINIEKENPIEKLYDKGYYSPHLFSFYRSTAKYCGDLLYNSLEDTKSYYTKEFFFTKQITDKQIIKKFNLKNDTYFEFLKLKEFFLWLIKTIKI